MQQDIPARSGSCVTSLTSDQVEGNYIAAGFGDGAIRIFDQREKPMRARTNQWKEHSSWIANIHMQRGGQRELVSGSRNGEVKLWDLRMNKSLKTIKATRDTLRSLSVHEHAPVFATYVSVSTLSSTAVLTTSLADPIDTWSRYTTWTATFCRVSNRTRAFWGKVARRL